MAEIDIKQIIYGELGNCIHIANGAVELVITVDVGPRIIRYGFIGKENEFCENAQMTKVVGDGLWNMMGGHRLWHSPEADPRSYMPEDKPVEWARIENGVRLVQKTEPWVQIQKEMEITLSSSSNKVKIVHRLTNKNAWPVELSAWAITVMAPGGKQVIPQTHRETGLLGNRLVALWPYTKMNDHRVYWGDKYITVRQDPNMQPAFKFGIPNEEGWALYFNHGNMFVKRYKHMFDEKYPDFGVSYETYTTEFMMEMETLSPLTLLKPDETITHVEEWDLFAGLAMPSNEIEIEGIVKKYIDKGAIL